jgi:hypothetical protein
MIERGREEGGFRHLLLYALVASPNCSVVSGKATVQCESMIVVNLPMTLKHYTNSTVLPA